MRQGLVNASIKASAKPCFVMLPEHTAATTWQSFRGYLGQDEGVGPQVNLL